MNFEPLSQEIPHWQQQADQYISEEKYSEAARLYEYAIEQEPENQLYYWYLGLILLLQEQEEEAQMTWFLGMTEGEPEEINQWTFDLGKVLEQAANQKAKETKSDIAWTIRRHIQEIQPNNINNLLHLVDLAIEIEVYTGKELIELQIINLLTSTAIPEVNRDLLLHCLKKILNYAPYLPSSMAFTEACIAYIDETRVNRLIAIILPLAYQLAYSDKKKLLALRYCEITLQVAPNHLEILKALSTFSCDLNQYSDAIKYAQQCYNLAERISDKVYYNHLILRSMMSAGGYWSKGLYLIEKQKELLNSLFKNPPHDLGVSAKLISLYSTTFYFPYLQDNPEENSRLRSQVAQICQSNIERNCPEEIKRFNQRATQFKQISQSFNQPLKVGYISNCLRRHSVGWLTRALFMHRNRENFQIYSYLLASDQNSDSLQEWYLNASDYSHCYGLASSEVADQIYEDQIDILVDLDSMTLTTTCGIMALKPAPVQVTWLGWDATGIPTIDYFIADPYVLPETAQDYYQETIWRLPHTYLAVDGFEVGNPNIRRSDLDIPNDAIIFWSSQQGPKYNLPMVRLQMKIIKEVPNSYFLIKGFGDKNTLNQFFLTIAEEEGLDINRIQFLSQVNTEEIHRANLRIADVVLDTYPYNGATTTMETLWMGIPIVTRVGQQFAARNSYTMMMNAGITEGIAWTDEEYIEWGIRLGTDESLRQQVAWKLKKSKQTATLWNGKQFTREMEKAYQQMWQIYLEGRDQEY